MLGPWQYTPYVFPLLIAGLLLPVLGIFIWRSPATWGRSGGMLVWATAFWSLASAAEIASANPEAMLRWDQTQFIGICAIPTTLFMFVSLYPGRARLISGWSILIVSVLPMSFLVLGLTAGSHSLVWSKIGSTYIGDRNSLVQEFGPALIGFMAYLYGLLIVVGVWLTKSFVRSRGLIRRQAGILIVGMSAPILLSLVEYLGLSPIEQMSLTPFAFSFTGISIFVNTFVFRFGGVVPVSNAVAVEHVAAGIVVTNDQGRVLSANPFSKNIFGWGRLAYAGFDLRQAVPMFSDWLTRREKSSPNDQSHDILGSFDYNGRAFDVSVTTAANRWFQRSHILLFSETTEQRESERALKNTESRFDLLFQQAPDAFCLLDDSRRVVRANDQAKLVTGLHFAEIVGKTLTEIGFRRIDGDRPASTQLPPFSVEHGVTTSIVTIHRTGKQESVAELTVHPITLGDRPGLLAMAHDITARRKAERELLIARDEAEAASRTKSDFLAHMSHELRTPLNHIIGFAQVLQDTRVGALSSRQSDYLSDILSSSRHLLVLINDILDLAKVEAGKMVLDRTSVDVEKLLESLVKSVRARTADRRITISVDLTESPDFVHADEVKLTQVFNNLIANAEKFTPNDGTITLSATIIASAGESDQPSVRFCVADSGVGLAPRDLDRIFMTFEQANNLGSKQHPGTGLGLPLSQRIVELHGGKIWAESDGPGKGSSFYFTLPQSRS